MCKTMVSLYRYVCREDWPTPEQNDTYSITLMILQFIIPLAVLIFTYTSIAIVVWCKRIPGEAENSRDQRMARSKRKVRKPLYDMLDIRWNRKISQPTNLALNTKPYVYVHLNVFCKKKVKQ